MAVATDSFTAWTERLPRWHGLLQLSPERPYHHAEEDYDRQYGVTAAEPEEGQGLCELIREHGVDTSGPALEIGCGTGRLTYGLARHYPGPDFLVTDPSLAFLRLTSDQLRPAADFPPRLSFAVLNADDMASLPADMFSLIAMRSTLHHILDVPAFLTASARALRPGGALVMGAEPVESGYLLMGMLGQSMGPTLRAAGVTLKPEWEKQIAALHETVQFYCRRDLDKRKAEDKHLFTPHDMADFGRRHGLQLRFYPNATFSDFAPPRRPEFASFSVFFLNYLEFCMMFDAELLALVRRHLQPQLNYVDECYRSHVGPAITGVFLLHKTGPAASR